ncbi:MAG TPA: hypothetical protein VMX18_04445 [Candidatus Bipolaricaulota bacterium]|nr:hypothetical protein [Candidatus Bipolaricaulota bacterium]
MICCCLDLTRNKTGVNISTSFHISQFAWRWQMSDDRKFEEAFPGSYGHSQLDEEIPSQGSDPESMLLQGGRELRLDMIGDELVRRLTPREEKILRMRFGIGEDDESPLKDKDMSEETRRRVELIEQKSLRNPRHPCQKNQAEARRRVLELLAKSRRDLRAVVDIEEEAVG